MYKLFKSLGGARAHLGGGSLGGARAHLGGGGVNAPLPPLNETLGVFLFFILY